jgi:ketosteroid isomerase-like protein
LVLNFLRLAVLVLLSSTMAQARSPQAFAIQAIDARFRQAMVRGDRQELERIVARDAKIIHGNGGGIQSGAGLIKAFRSYGIKRYDRTPVSLTVSGDAAILLSITHKYFAGGRRVDTTTTELLARRSGRWQIVLLQNTDHSAR